MEASLFGPATKAAIGAPVMQNSEGDLAVAPAAAGGGPVAGAEGLQHRFEPYELNGGTALAIAGDDYVVIAADTRLSRGYQILSRNVSKLAQVSTKCIIGTGGCWADVATLHKMMALRCETYKHEHGAEISTQSVAQLLSTTLYSRRFMPYYAFNVVGGIDEYGKGAVYTYDAVGSFERIGYACQGSAQKLIIPLLDNLVGHRNRADPDVPLTRDQVLEIVKDSFVTAGERDIMTGDAVEIYVLFADGRVETQVFELKKD